MDAGPRGGPLVRRALKLAVILGSLAGLAWLVATEHDQLGRAPAGVTHAKLALVAALVGVGEPAARAAVAVMIYRLIRLWLVLLVGWVLFIVISSRRARRIATSTQPRANRGP